MQGQGVTDWLLLRAVREEPVPVSLLGLGMTVFLLTELLPEHLSAAKGLLIKTLVL